MRLYGLEASYFTPGAATALLGWPLARTMAAMGSRRPALIVALGVLTHSRRRGLRL